MIARMGGLQSQRQRIADPAADASHRCRESYHQHITRRPGFRWRDLYKISTSPPGVHSNGRVNIFDRVAIANSL